MKRLLATAVLAGGMASALPAAATQAALPCMNQDLSASPWSRSKIIAAMRNRNNETQNLTLVAAHRGYWEQYPENSWEALTRAGFACHFEIVEADIKPARGGVPMVFHDFELDRASMGHGKLADQPAEALQQVKLRDRFGQEANTIMLKGSSLVEGWFRTLQQYGGMDGGPVLAFDVKALNYADVWPQAEQLFRQIRVIDAATEGAARNAFVFKIEARSLPKDPAVVEQLIAGTTDLFHLIVVLNPTDEDSACALNANNQNCVANKYRSKNYVVGYEVNLPYPGSRLEPLLDGRLPGAIGGFVTYYDQPTGVGNSQAICCSTLNTNTDVGPGDKLDYRARWDWHTSVKGANNERAFRVITIDRPDILNGYLKSIGLRDTSVIRRTGAAQ